MGFAFLFDLKLRYPVGMTIGVKFVVMRYRLEPRALPVDVLGEFVQRLLEEFRFLPPHSG